MKKILVVIGTRPEAIKMALIISALRSRGIVPRVLATAQHRGLLDQALGVFGIKPDYDLDVMSENQTLNGVVETILHRLDPILREEKPDCVLVQGDTTTAFAAALAAFYCGIKVGHVEAGLRTYDKFSPFPEEMNRQLIGRLADIHFAPTENAKKNLLSERVPSENIHLVGNTEIDAIIWVVGRFNDPAKEREMEEKLKKEYGLELDGNKRIVLVTAHRRESFGEGLKNICGALKEIASKKEDTMFVYPVHPNPNVQRTVHSILDGTRNVFLTPAMDYETFAFLMNKSYLILTDSGGIQESAPSLGKPVLVMREKTERMEGVEAGVSKLVGTDKEKIVRATLELLDNPGVYVSMTGKKNPYGDGTASEKIASALENYLK
ncbi:UDP-N-acetylglucosamine 2-epimerase (non-hydrolyzing) [bacterium]|nr:MAG: UDP-N-acetylglucosamine 2-epimerase (non-hydrolyzing) [bacterium]